MGQEAKTENEAKGEDRAGLTNYQQVLPVELLPPAFSGIAVTCSLV